MTAHRAATTAMPLAVLLAGLSAWALSGARAAGETYVVNRQHPSASDQNAGTGDRPFRTIARAAGAVRPGDTVVIRSGVYRESVTVDASGTAEAPITFQAGPADRVVVTGADEIADWRAEDPNGGQAVYSAAWPHRFIAWSKHSAHPDDEFHRLIGRAEQVVIDGQLLHQVLRREAVGRGAFYADLAGKRLYVCARDGRDLTKGGQPVEVSVRPALWLCKGSHVRMSGIRFRYAANAAQHGAVQMLGDHGVVEDCVFERANSIGAAFAGRQIAVRRCEFRENGQMGFSAVRAHGLRMSECLVRGNSTKGWSRGWEAGGNKIVLSRGVVVEHSAFLANGGNGVWFDIGNERCTVRNCLIADNEAAGLFYEISFGLHAHDNVIVGNGFGGSREAWGADGGISLSSSPGCRVERNLIVGNKEGLQFREQARTTPRIDDGRDAKPNPVWNRDHVIRNNAIAYNRDWQVAGWFDVADARHWPKASPTAGAASRDGNRPARADAPPAGPSLAALKLALEGNLYHAEPGQGLYQWGCPWRRHKTYNDLAAVARELGLEADSRDETVTFASYARRDFRVPADSPAMRMGCYPRGEVPGVKLGALGPP